MPLMTTFCVAASLYQVRIPTGQFANGYLVELPQKYEVPDVASFRMVLDGHRIVHQCTGPECAKFAATDNFKMPERMIGGVSRHFSEQLNQWGHELLLDVQGIGTLDLSKPLTDGDLWRIWRVIF